MTPYEEKSIVRVFKLTAGFVGLCCLLTIFDWGPLAVFLLWWIAFVKK